MKEREVRVSAGRPRLRFWPTQSPQPLRRGSLTRSGACYLAYRPPHARRGGGSGEGSEAGWTGDTGTRSRASSRYAPVCLHKQAGGTLRAGSRHRDEAERALGSQMGGRGHEDRNPCGPAYAVYGDREGVQLYAPKTAKGRRSIKLPESALSSLRRHRKAQE
jgi:hypothetical protein